MKKILHHTFRICMILGVYIERVCDVTHYVHPEYNDGQSKNLGKKTYTLTPSYLIKHLGC